MCACLCVNPFLFILDKRLGIDRLYIKCMFNFIRNYQIVLQSDCTILHNYQQYIRVLLTHIFIKTFFFSLLNFIHFRKWDVVVIMVLIYIWLMTCMMLNIFAYDFTNLLLWMICLNIHLFKKCYLTSHYWAIRLVYRL